MADEPTAAAPKQLTSYDVFAAHASEADTWVKVKSVKAPSRVAAIRKVVTPSENPQTFFAAPSKSTVPVTVSVETKTHLKLT